MNRPIVYYIELSIVTNSSKLSMKLDATEITMVKQINIPRRANTNSATAPSEISPNSLNSEKSEFSRFAKDYINLKAELFHDHVLQSTSKIELFYWKIWNCFSNKKLFD
jgi:hypothetical protein